MVNKFVRLSHANAHKFSHMNTFTWRLYSDKFSHTLIFAQIRGDQLKYAKIKLCGNIEIGIKEKGF